MLDTYDKYLSLINYLNERTKEYDEGHPTISDKEYDDKYFELIRMEYELGNADKNSPTQRINYNAVNSLKKVQHNHKMLSLDKTKDIEKVKSFIGDEDFLAMLKMDGLTCSLRYVGGKLVSAETRGNGSEGEDILHNALIIPSIPNHIPIKEELIIDGEIVCTKYNFKQFEDTYKNPRNFAAGSIRLLNPKECEMRNLTFVVWEIIKGFNEFNTLSDKLFKALEYGFITVPTLQGNIDNIEKIIDSLKGIAELYGFPIDGIVFKFNDIEYGKTLGATDHHFKNAIAYKFYDDLYDTSLKDIEWTMGRTGVLTPVAVFNEIDIDGSTVERASLHNLSIMRTILGDTPQIGQSLKIFKANQIIPQVKSSIFPLVYIQDLILDIPTKCPICGGEVKIQENEQVQNLICVNPNCEGKFINKLEHFCSKKGLDIKGLSKATLEKLVEWEWIICLEDLFKLKEHRIEWIKKAGFGEKSVDKILDAIETARNTTDLAFIAALGIPLIGSNVAKELLKYFPNYIKLREAIDESYDFSCLDGFAEAKTLALRKFDFFEADNIYHNYLTITHEEVLNENNQSCKDLKFVITGKLNKYKKRDDLKTIIENLGGKVIDSVSKNTNYLINNDITSTTGKNQSAQKLGIPIITEEEFEKNFLK